MNKEFHNQSDESFERDLEMAVVNQTDSDLRKTYERKLKEDFGIEKGNSSLRKYYYIAAFILAIVIAGIYVYQSQKSNALTPDLYASNMIAELKVKDNPAWDMRGGESVQNVAEIEAYKEVKAGNYQLALAKYDQINASSLTTESEYYRGLALMKLKKYNEAQLSFEKLTKEDNNYKQEAKWMLALAYTADEDLEKAKKQLEEIINNKEYNWSLASDLLNSILNQ